MLAVQVTADADDADGPTSPYALCLLQLALWPPCDVGTVLPFGELASITGNEEALLYGVILSPGTTEATLLAAADPTSLQSYALSGSDEVDVAWRALCLSLRYRPHGCRLFATDAALQSALALEAVPEDAMPVEDVRATGAAATSRLFRAAESLMREGGARDGGDTTD